MEQSAHQSVGYAAGIPDRGALHVEALSHTSQMHILCNMSVHILDAYPLSGQELRLLSPMLSQSYTELHVLSRCAMYPICNVSRRMHTAQKLRFAYNVAAGPQADAALKAAKQHHRIQTIKLWHRIHHHTRAMATAEQRKCESRAATSGPMLR